MATRRPPSRLAKPIATSSNSQPSKPRQPTTRTPAPLRSADEKLSSPELSHAPQRLNKSSNSLDDYESNIQVVIRCRRRSEREIQDNSPIIVTSIGAKSKELIIEAGAPISSLGIVQLPPTRKYNFDMVFGPEADQTMLYHDVVHPMLEEVLMGYNCTLFAYGQTGTGKTYTMQGDLVPTPMGNPSPNAGMIPRVVFRLFHELEKSGVDYSVKISFVELYNEELRDLLANELLPPSGNTQPMGAGVKDSKGQEGALKIFDDSNKKGVFIQGLEEIAVKDCRDALGLLTKGSLRRQIAATKFNDHSSRSHSVFSITIHTKETSSIGDDLLKVGKLNLVDLAGSENIGRSGAENKRAREAGMINQSLLTLGRVINALVDRAQHVPYRESKLTRLLQDSLGGHTKTCIIATISPARSNMEETLSTLDYALRAKSIRNKPELNQRMSRNALLKEYIAEIERLKADIMATREKNGIYFSEENWKQICDEQELQATELAEAKKQVEIVEKELRSVREEYDESIALLKHREHELNETRGWLSEREETLAQTEDELEKVQVTLGEEIIVRKAHQHTEAVLDGVATKLNEVVKDSLQDVSGLFSKLERKQSVLSANSQVVTTHGNTIFASTAAFTQKLNSFIKSATQHVDHLRDEAKEFETKYIESLIDRSNGLEEYLRLLTKSISVIQTHGNTESEALQSIRDILKETIASLQTESVSWGEKWKESSQRHRQTITILHKEGFTSLENALKGVASVTESVLKESFHFIEMEQNLMQEAKSLTDNANTVEIQRLRKQNQTLTKLLDDEKQKSQKAQQDLVQRISSMLGDYVNERDRSLRNAVELLHDENKQATDSLSSFASNYDQIMVNNRAQAVNTGSTLCEKSKEHKKTRDMAFKSLDGLCQDVDTKFEAIQTTASESIDSVTGTIRHYTQAMSSSCTTSFEEHGRAKRARLEATSSLTAEVQAEYGSISKALGSMSHQVKSVTSKIATETTGLNDLMVSYQNNAASQLDVTRSAAQALAEQGTRDDIPTGSTPRKRVWEIVDHWELTKGRDEILKVRKVQTEDNATLPSETHQDSTNIEDDAEVRTQHLKSPTPDLITSSESPASLISSLSSTASIPMMPPRTQPLANRKVPRSTTQRSTTQRSTTQPMGALVDFKNVYTTRGSRRK